MQVSVDLKSVLKAAVAQAEVPNETFKLLKSAWNALEGETIHLKGLAEEWEDGTPEERAQVLKELRDHINQLEVEESDP